MTDHQIIELIKKGRDEKAFQSLYQHFPMIRKLIMSKGGRLEDAEDIYQEALIILHRKVTGSEFILTSKLSTYMYSICRFLWNDELIKKQKHQFIELDANLDKAEEDSLNEIRMKENNSVLAAKIINELGDRCKEILILFYAEAMKLKDIATKMKYSSENTAKNQKYKCLESAKNKLKEAKQSLVS
jgi:RNA polymerase sigma factor (sigma-70 family)